MKYVARPCVLAAVALLCVPLVTDSAPAEAASRSCKIKCRGGNDIELSYDLDLPVGWASIDATTLSSKHEFRLSCQKSPVTGTEAIPEGACSWMDRSFNSVEYARLR